LEALFVFAKLDIKASRWFPLVYHFYKSYDTLPYDLYELFEFCL